MILRAPLFSLTDSVESGQIFRFHPHDDGYAIFHRQEAFLARQEGARLHITGTSRRFARRFFGLDHPLAEILERLKGDEALRPAIQAHRGLRILHQDPWECAVSFICSSCASIPKIRLNLEELSRRLGEPVEVDGVRGHSFPEPGTLRSLATLKAAKTGYRARYLQSLNRRPEVLESLSKDFATARQTLLGLDGVGEKVADCILLFGYAQHRAFPVDTWVRKGMQHHYFGGENVSERQIRTFADERFGEDAGYAQQYIFHHSRLTKL